MVTDISLTSQHQVVQLINEQNGVDLSLERVNFQDVRALVDDPDGKNTEVTVIAVPNKGYSGSVVVKYNRNTLQNFESLNGNQPISLFVSPNDSLGDIVSKFNVMFDCNLVLGHDIDPNLELPDFSYDGDNISLVVLPQSLAYTDSLMLNIALPTFPLNTVIVTNTLDGLRFSDDTYLDREIEEPNLLGFNYGVVGVPVVWIGAQYTFNLDLTNYFSTLQGFTQGTVLTQSQGSSLVTALAYADLDGSHRAAWKSNVGATGGNLIWNLHGATVMSNGLNLAPTTPTNPKYKYVLELKLRADITEPLGNVYLHYNEPINPLDVINPNE